MTSAAFASLAALGAAFTALDLLPFLLDLEPGSGSTSTPTASTFQVPLVFAATVAIFASVAFIFLHHAARNRNMRLSELVPFTLCTAAGFLVLFLFVLPAGDVGAAVVGAIGGAAVDALPASAAASFFLGTTVVIAHIRAGGEGGGGEEDDVADGNRRVDSLEVVKRIALGGSSSSRRADRHGGSLHLPQMMSEKLGSRVAPGLYGLHSIFIGVVCK